MIYLDQAATSFQKPPQVAQAVRRAFERCGSIGRGGHTAAVAAARTAFETRQLAAQLFDAAPEQVVFTFNATHGLNIAIRSLAGPGDRVVISGFEHNAVLRPLHLLGAEIEVAGRQLFDPADTLRDFERAVTPNTRAVICTHVSNVFGYRLPVEEIAALCRQKGVPFVLDASQSAGVLPVSLRALAAAYIAMPGHKGLYGPQGTGLLLCGQLPQPLLAGGTGSLSQLVQMPEFLPDRVEAGTHNIHGIAGLLEGIRFVQAQGRGICTQERHLLDRLAARLENQPQIRMFYTQRECQCGVASIVPAGCDCESLARELDERGVAVRAGLQCAPLAHRSAGTLDTGTVRVSVSAFNTEEEIDRFSEILSSCSFR